VFMCLKEGKYQYGVVICYASGIMGYDRKTPELSNASIHTKQDTDSIEIFKNLRLDLPAACVQEL